MTKRSITKKATEESAASRWILGVVLFGCVAAGIFSAVFNEHVTQMDTEGRIWAGAVGYMFATIAATIILSILVWVLRAITRVVNKRGKK